MSLLDRIQQDLITAMKARDQERLGTVRMIKTALKKLEVDSRAALDQTAEYKVLNTLVKQRKDAIAMYNKGGRPELAAKEEAELEIIHSYLPAAATDEEMNAAVAAAIEETGAESLRQMGLAMKVAREKLAGKTIDGKTLSDKVRTALD